MPVAGVERGRAYEKRDYGKPPVVFVFVSIGIVSVATRVRKVHRNIGPEQHDLRVRREGLEHPRSQSPLRARDEVNADRRLDLERQPGSNRPHDVLRPALFPLHPVAQVPVILSRDVKHGAAARFARYVVLEQCSLRHEHAG